jgi:hypothetical protein
MPRLALPLLLAALTALAAPAFAQTPPAGLRVQVFVDERRSAEAREPHAGYRLQAAAQALRLQPDAGDLMQRWKGDAVLGQPTRASMGRDASSWPVFLVLDLSNEATRPLQATATYLEVETSVTDPQPFIAFAPWGYESFELRNHGAGSADEAVLRFAFGPKQPATEVFALPLGALGAVRVSPERALASLVPALPRLREQPPECASFEQVPDCLARLRGTHELGRLDDFAYVYRDRVLTRLTGTLAYHWRDAAGAVQQRTHPVDVEVQLFRFKVPEGYAAAPGPPAPEQRGYAPIALQPGRSNYRLPLPYRPLLTPGQNQRFELALTAPQSSSHRFRVVAVSSDGRRVASEWIELLYFVPRMDVGEVRQVR